MPTGLMLVDRGMECSEAKVVAMTIRSDGGFYRRVPADSTVRVLSESVADCRTVRRIQFRFYPLKTDFSADSM